MEKKILFIPRWFPNKLDKFNGIFIQRHAIAVALKHPVAVLYVNADPSMKEAVYEKEFSMEEGVAVVRVYYNNSSNNASLFSTFIKFLRYLKACRIGIALVKKNFGIPDLVHIHVLSRTFLPAYYFKCFFNKPYIVSEQWSGYLPEDGMYKGFLKKTLTGIAIRKASAVTTVSASLKNAMLDHGLKNEYTIVPNVVDTNLFSPIIHPMKRDKFMLLHVSNLDDRAKNVSGMLRAVKIVLERRNDFEFNIIGDGEDKGKLEELATQLGILNTCVIFLGAKTPAQVAVKMQQADLFLLFSNYDNMPCVMVESFASGLPVIGSNIHGIKEHVNEKRGMVIMPGEEEAFAEAIIQAMNNIHLFNKAELSKYAKERFSYDAVANQLDAIYQKIILK